MTHRLHPLPEPLLRQLGCAADEQTLSEVLQPYKPSQAGLFRTQSNEPYAVGTAQPGLSLMVQCLDSQQSPEKRLWGLQALSFQTRQASERDYWVGPWPKGLDPQTAKAEDLTRLMTAVGADMAQAPRQGQQGVEPASVHLHMPNLCCIEVPGYDKRRWMVQGIFDFASKTLTHLMLLRVGDWVLPSVAEPTPAKTTLLI